MGEERRLLVERTELAERSERWADMVDLVRQVIELGTDLNVHERNLLATAYKQFVGVKRASWRVVCCIEERIVGPNVRKRELARAYRLKIEAELRDTCTELLCLVEKLLQKTNDMESRIFYLKLTGDYYRYMSELCSDAVDKDILFRAKKAYDDGLELSKKHLGAAEPLHLGLVLNTSVFYYEMLQASRDAVAMVTTCVRDASEEIQQLPPSSKGDSSLILKLLKENMKLWQTELEEKTK